jgi:hypothetical protein
MLIEQSEGTVYGCRYYTAKPQVESTPSWDKIIAWVVDTYGPTPEDGVWTPNARWYVNNAKFWFRNLEDVTMFVLRWS